MSPTTTRLRHRLGEIEGVMVRDKGFVKCGIVTFTVDGIDAVAVKATLAQLGTTVSVTQHASTVIDMTQRNLDSMVRASVHYFNTDDEIDRTADAVASLARRSVQRLR